VLKFLQHTDQQQGEFPINYGTLFSFSKGTFILSAIAISVIVEYSKENQHKFMMFCFKETFFPFFSDKHLNVRCFVIEENTNKTQVQHHNAETTQPHHKERKLPVYLTKRQKEMPGCRMPRCWEKMGGGLVYGFTRHSTLKHPSIAVLLIKAFIFCSFCSPSSLTILMTKSHDKIQDGFIASQLNILYLKGG
jgi:hypothetical protein